MSEAPALSLRDLTGELPAEIVGQPLTIAIWVTNIEGETGPTGRPVGRHAVGIRLGDRENPELTAQERAYVLAVLRYAAWKVSGRPTTDLGSPESPSWGAPPEVIAPWPDTEMSS